MILIMIWFVGSLRKKSLLVKKKRNNVWINFIFKFLSLLNINFFIIWLMWNSKRIFSLILLFIYIYIVKILFFLKIILVYLLLS